MRFKRVNYNESVKERIYERMISERQQIAERFRSEGAGEAAKILGNMEKELREIESGAYKEVETIKGRPTRRRRNLREGLQSGTRSRRVLSVQPHHGALSGDARRRQHRHPLHRQRHFPIPEADRAQARCPGPCRRCRDREFGATGRINRPRGRGAGFEILETCGTQLQGTPVLSQFTMLCLLTPNHFRELGLGEIRERFAAFSLPRRCGRSLRFRVHVFLGLAFATRAVVLREAGPVTQRPPVRLELDPEDVAEHGRARVRRVFEAGFPPRWRWPRRFHQSVRDD